MRLILTVRHFSKGIAISPNSTKMMMELAKGLTQVVPVVFLRVFLVVFSQMDRQHFSTQMEQSGRLLVVICLTSTQRISYNFLRNVFSFPV